MDENPVVDPLIDEVRARRKALLNKHQNDLKSLFEAIRRLQESHLDQVLDAHKRRSDR